MREVHFSTLDLNLLRVFDALAEERSVTRAGERLGLTQSAVSHALNRLRYALEDELFLRGPDGMTPTPRAVEIWPDLRRGLAQLQHALAPTEFDPAVSERVFNLSASAYTGEVLMPLVIARVRSEAPGIQIHVRTITDFLGEALDTGRIDLAIGVFGRISEMFAREALFHERLVWAVRSDHPALSDPTPTKALQRIPLIILAPGDSERGGGERSNRLVEPRVLWEELASGASQFGRGARERVRVVVDNAHSALAMVSASDLAALVPRRLALSRATALGLTLVDLPEEGRPAVAMEAVWRHDQGGHPALTWLRGVIRDAARDA